MTDKIKQIDGEPPTVEDAKALDDLKEQARLFVEWAGFKGMANHTLVTTWMAEFAEQYAAKQIERQTPAIIERFVEEVENEQFGCCGNPIQDYEEGDASTMGYPVLVSEQCCGRPEPIMSLEEAMQTVKARREGGEM